MSDPRLVGVRTAEFRHGEDDADERRIVSDLYPDHRPWDLEPHYHNHVGGMTEFRLHRKSDIALQLAWRDKRIAELEAERHRAWAAGMAEGYHAGKNPAYIPEENPYPSEVKK